MVNLYASHGAGMIIRPSQPPLTPNKKFSNYSVLVSQLVLVLKCTLLHQGCGC